MDPKDSFLSNLGTKRNLFEGYNEKTLGLLVASILSILEITG